MMGIGARVRRVKTGFIGTIISRQAPTTNTESVMLVGQLPANMFTAWRSIVAREMRSPTALESKKPNDFSSIEWK